MARPCVDCGLTYNSSGQLIVNASTWPYSTTGCADASSGTDLYCAPDGTIHGPAEKFVVDDERLVQPFVGTRQLNTLAPVDNATHNIGAPLVFQVANPSNCRDAQLIIESGVIHGQWEKTGNGNARSTVNSRVTVAGAVVAGPQQGAHALYGHSGNLVTEIVDVMGSYQRHDWGVPDTDLILPAGGVITITLQGQIVVTAYNGNASYANLIFGCRYRIVSL